MNENKLNSQRIYPEIQSWILFGFNNNSLKFEESSAEMIKIEFLMRCIGEISEAVRNEMEKIATTNQIKIKKQKYEKIKEELNFLETEIKNTENKKNINYFKKIKKTLEDSITPKKENSKYYECNPSLLVQAIIEVFKNDLDNEEIEQIKKYSKIRGKYDHGLFIPVLKMLNIDPEGRLLSKNKKINLKETEILESLGAFFRQSSKTNKEGYREIKIYGNKVIEILQKLLKIAEKEKKFVDQY